VTFFFLFFFFFLRELGARFQAAGAAESGQRAGLAQAPNCGRLASYWTGRRSQTGDGIPLNLSLSFKEESGDQTVETKGRAGGGGGGGGGGGLVRIRAVVS